jgi:hypothetical protein
MPEKKQRRGRPTKKTPELLERFCALVANGSPAITACRRLGIGYTALCQWRREDPEFATAYARAREDRAELLADEIIALADAAQGLDSAGVQACRLRVDARKWAAAKLLPRVYGDRIEHVGEADRVALPVPISPMKIAVSAHGFDRLPEHVQVRIIETLHREGATGLPTALGQERQGAEDPGELARLSRPRRDQT